MSLFARYIHSVWLYFLVSFSDNRTYRMLCMLFTYIVLFLASWWTVQCNTHTHTHLMALFPGLPGWASTSKVKPIWILLKQETVSGSGISWAICKSASHSRQITMPVPHYSFLQARCPSCRATNSANALKAIALKCNTHSYKCRD